MKKIFKTIKQTNKNFIKCGLVGWIMEICWTGFLSFRKREKKLTCKTSVWMFPIYGMACLLLPVSRLIKEKCAFLRGFLYTVIIFCIEFSTGFLLKRKNACPWDYTNKKYNVKGLIRLDYAPLWFFSGLLFEKITKK